MVELYSDRGYYDGRFFAYAYFREFECGCRQSKPLRFIVPKKYPRGKEEKKRAIFEDPNYPEIKLSSIQLNWRCEPHLRNLCGYYNVPYSDGYYHIPMVEVVCTRLWDDGAPLSFRDAKKRYFQYKEEEQGAVRAVAAAEEAYVSYMNYLGFKKQKAPLTHGRGCRVKIRIPKQYVLLMCLKKARERLCRIRSSLQTLMDSVSVICVSMVHDEVFHEHCYEWLYCARRYRERWAIENGFRDIKKSFLLESRSRKPLIRFSRVVVGMRLYNLWHVSRLREMVRRKRVRNPRYIPFDPKVRHLRRRVEREYGSVLSARGYLLRLVRNQLRFQLNRLFTA